MAEKKEKQYEDENGYYIWRTVRGKPVKIYKEKSIYESIVMSNLQKSLQKEIEATKVRNADYIAEKLKNIGFEKAFGSNIGGLDIKGNTTTNVDMINKCVDKLAEVNKQYPLKTVKLGSFAIDFTQYFGFTSYNYLKFERQSMTVSRYRYSQSLKEVTNGDDRWAYSWTNSIVYDDEVNDAVECPIPTYKMHCWREDIPYYTFMHEYGHILEHDIIIERMRKTIPDFGKEGSTADALSVKKTIQSQDRKIKNEILKIYKTDPELVKEYGKTLDWKHFMSLYGQSKPAEFFAEAFVGSVLARDNDFGNNNRLIKAFRIWLKKERGYGEK